MNPAHVEDPAQPVSSTSGVSPSAQDSAATRYTNTAYGKFASASTPVDPAGYFARRSSALQLAYESKWGPARQVLDSLVTEYVDDGDIWYLLGLSCMNTEDWVGAISAFERTIELGTVLHGIPTGSAPSNDVMIMVAEAHAALGDVRSSKLWTERALSSRYDDRPSLADRVVFEKALSAVEFRKLTGDHVDSGVSRDELWRGDLRVLVAELRRLHVNLHHLMSASELQRRVEAIAERIPELSDQEIVFEFMKLVGALGNGHNLLIPTNGAKGSFSRLPVAFYWFSDGLFIVDADETHADLIGRGVKNIGGVPAVDALDKTRILNARDNEMQHSWLAPYYVSLPEALLGLGVIDDATEVALTLSCGDDGATEVILRGGDWSFDGFPKLPKLRKAAQPRYLDKSDRIFWMEVLPDQDTVFVQLNWVAEHEGTTLAAFSRELTAKIESNHAKNLILDLRHNPGGDGSILPSLLRALIHFEVANPEGTLFVIAGRGTFSAAHTLLADINRLTNAVIVGEPSGSRPNALGEAGWFKLPHSGLMGLASTQFHQDSSAEDHRIWIAPHVPTSLSSEDYFSGKDPALAAIFAVNDLSATPPRLRPKPIAQV